MIRLLVCGLSLFAWATQAAPILSTTVEATLTGIDLARYGGPVIDFGISIVVPDDAPDLSGGAPWLSQFAGPITLRSASSAVVTMGWLQFELPVRERAHPQAELVFTIPFPGQTFPGVTLNTQVSGFELHLIDQQGTMLSTPRPRDLTPNYANEIDALRLFVREGGWGPDQGRFVDVTDELLHSTRLVGDVVRSTFPLSEPDSGALILAVVLLGTASSVSHQRRGPLEPMEPPKMSRARQRNGISA